VYASGFSASSAPFPYHFMPTLSGHLFRHSFVSFSAYFLSFASGVNNCKYKYTFNGKTREFPEEVKQQAIKTYYSGVSARGVGKIFGMGKENVLRWIKKTELPVDKSDN